jgi:hypothetical protein
MQKGAKKTARSIARSERTQCLELFKILDVENFEQELITGWILTGPIKASTTLSLL